MIWSSMASVSSKYPDLAFIRSYSDLMDETAICVALKCERILPTQDLIGNHLDSGEMLPFGPQGVSDLKEKEQVSIPITKNDLLKHFVISATHIHSFTILILKYDE